MERGKERGRRKKGEVKRDGRRWGEEKHGEGEEL